MTETTYFTPILDADVPAKYQPTLVKYRLLATEHGVPATTALCYRVRAEFTLKKHAPQAGPCYQNFQYLQDWDFPDEPTKDCFVFWVPRIVNGSTSKTKDQQIEFLADLRAKLELPAHHLNGFGPVGLVAGLILAHHQATGECLPLNGHWVRTDNCYTVGYRHDLGDFGGGDLDCSNWDFAGDAYDSLGVFALGVEELGD